MDKIIRPIAPEDLKRILSAQDDPKADMIKIALYTGLRVGELIRLEGSKVNFKEGYIRCEKEVFKTRYIPIHRDIKPGLERMVKESGNGILFKDTDGTPYSPHRFRRKVFEILLPGYSTHATRYTFIMQWVNLNLDLQVMARITDYRKGEVSVKQLQQEMDKFFYLEV